MTAHVFNLAALIDAPFVKRPLTSPHIRHASADRQRKVEIVPNEVDHSRPDFALGRLFQKYRQISHTPLPTRTTRQAVSGAVETLSFNRGMRPDSARSPARYSLSVPTLAGRALVAPDTLGPLSPDSP